MKILHTDTDDLGNPLHGGQPLRTFEINSRLSVRHDIAVYTAVYRGCRRSEVRGGITYRRLGMRIPPFGLSPHMTFLACLGLQLRRVPHDLVVEEFTPPVGFCGLPWWTVKPVVSMVQWYFFDFWEKRYHLPFETWMRRISRAGRYRAFIVQTEAMGRRFRDLIPEADIRVIPCGVNQDAFLDDPPLGDYALFIGRLDTVHKGLDMLLDVWRDGCAGESMRLVIAGEGPARDHIEMRLKREGLSGLVTLAGRVSGEAKADLLRGCRLLVMPSRFETFGIVALEAMAAAKPVVAFDIAELNEVARPPWAELITAFDVDAFGRAVRGLWSSPERCLEMGAAGRERARAYLWDRIAERQEAFYHDVIAKTRGPAGRTGVSAAG